MEVISKNYSNDTVKTLEIDIFLKDSEILDWVAIERIRNVFIRIDKWKVCLSEGFWQFAGQRIHLILFLSSRITDSALIQ